MLLTAIAGCPSPYAPVIERKAVAGVRDIRRTGIIPNPARFITAAGINSLLTADFGKAQKSEMLTQALARYNNGRMKRFLCELFIHQDIDTLKEIMRRAENLSGDPKEIGKAFQDIVREICAK